MKNIFTIIGFVSIFLLSACGNPEDEIINSNNITNSIESEKTDIDEKVEKIPMNSQKIEDNIIKIGEKVQDPFVEGNLYYTVKQCNIFDNINQLDISKESIFLPSNVYNSYEIGDQYQAVSDYVTEEGMITKDHKLIILELHIENLDANGLFKKSEFNINDISVIGGDTINYYNIAYFSAAGEINDSNELLYYKLEQGENTSVQIGFLVLSDDLESGKIVGKIGQTQFEIM